MIRIPPTRYVLPNLFTLSAAFCGFAMIWMGQNAETARQFSLAATLVPCAVLLDGFDGRVARLLHGESRFGVQMDSLSDFLSFGVAPAYLIYFWALQPLGAIGLVGAFAYAACAMIRLARFNVRAEEDGGASRYFEGLPSPAAGMCIAGVIAVDTGLLHRTELAETARWSVLGYVLFIGLLMVSNLPFRTFKDVRKGRRTYLAVGLVLGCVTWLGFRTNLLVALSMGIFAYVLSGLTASFFRRGPTPGGGPPSGGDDEDLDDPSADEDVEPSEPQRG